MNTPTPVPEKTGWIPTTSTAVGGVLGTALAQLLIAGIQAYIHANLAPETASAITTVCVVLSSYVFKDGGRK